MLTQQEIILAVLVPVIVSALIAAIGAWRRWPWMMPLAAGVAFLVAYGCIIGMGIIFPDKNAPPIPRSDWQFWPKFPPGNGNDWIFWLAIPLMALAVVDGLLKKRWGAFLAAFAIVVAVMTLKPLVHDPPTKDGVQSHIVWTMSVVVGVTAVAISFLAGSVQERVGSLWVVMSLCIVIGGTGVVIFSSDSRTMGLDGIAAAAALGPAAVLGMRLKSAQSIAVYAVPVLAALLMIGRFYAEPGVSWVNFFVLLCAPALVLIGALMPLKQQWLRGAISLLAVTIAVAAVTGPTALAAKEAAEKNKSTPEDPYEKMYK